MPRQPNRALRLVVPILLVIGIVGFGFLMLRRPAGGTPANPQTPAGQASSQPTNPSVAPLVAPAPAPSAAPGVTGVALAPGAALRARVFPDAAAPGGAGSLDPKQHRVRVEFSTFGAGLREVRLSEHFDTIKRAPGEEMVLQREVRTGLAGRENEPPLTPLAMLALRVGPPEGPGQIINVFADTRGPVWRPLDAPGAFEAIVEDEAGNAVLRVERRYALPNRSHDLELAQHVTNLTASPLRVTLYQTGPVELAQDAAGYGGDKRRVQFGYLLPPSRDPTRSFVVADDFRIDHATALGERVALKGANGEWLTDINNNAVMGFVDTPLWPNETSREKQYTLCWAGMTNRYYGASVHRRGVGPGDKSLAWVNDVSRVVLDAGVGAETMALRLESIPAPLARAGQAGDTADLSLTLYAGPLSRETIREQPASALHGLAGMVFYNFGGPCALCTFQWLVTLLLWLLHTLHDRVTFDWGVAIIVLVLIVRTLLHPVTRWSQIRMARWSKQMQAVAPKQKQIMEKFRDDPARLRQEISRLNEEEGVSHAGALGCLPGFLQSPIWWALSALLYFAVELRHEAAFYGVFQKIQPQASPFWQFLGDLAQPDRFLYAGRTLFTLPMLGPIESLNVIPIALGVLFYAQQKYMSPPQTPGSMTPEQEMQMKMTRWMMVIMFPLVMYNAPSGLALYFLANSTIALLEGKWVRSHMEATGLLDVEKMKAERRAKRARDAARGKGPGLFARIQQRIEEAQATAAQQQRRPGDKR